MIRSGRFCKSCKDRLANSLGNMYQKPQETIKKDNRASGKGKMRFLDN